MKRHVAPISRKRSLQNAAGVAPPTDPAGKLAQKLGLKQF